MKTILYQAKSVLIAAFILCMQQAWAQVPSAAYSDSAAQEIKVGNCAINCTFNDATVNDPAASACDVPTRDGWLWFDATSTKTSICFFNNSSRNAAMYVYTSGPVELACKNDLGPNRNEVMVLATTIGTRYHVRIAKIGGGAPILNGDVCIYNTPGNDDCASAVQMAVTPACELIAGSTIGASLSANPITCNTLAGRSDDDVWYSFIAPASGNANISVKGASAGFNPVIDLRSGGCNGTSINCADASASNGDETIIATGLTAGQSYLIRVYGFDEGSRSSIGTFSICVSDNCAQIVSYNLTGGGAYCNGGSGMPVGLSGSETTAQYQLKLNGVNVGAPVAGTGNPFSFGSQASVGSYSVEASDINSPSCPVNMSGTASVSIASAMPYPYTGNVTASVAGACAGSAFTATVQPVAGAAEYVWSLPEGSSVNGTLITSSNPTVTSTSTTANIVAGNPYGAGYYIFVYAQNACGRTHNAKATWVQGTLSTPIMSSGSKTVCATLSEKYSIQPVAGADEYSWTVTTTAGTAAFIMGASNGTDIDVSFPDGFISADICVVARLTCGLASASRCISVSTAPALPGSMAGADKVCPGAMATYSIAKVNGAASYAWSMPAGATLVSTGLNATHDTAVVQFSSSYVSGMITVTPVSACDMPGMSRSKSVYINAPAMPATISGPMTGACNAVLNYSTSASLPLAGQFQWTMNGNIQASTSNSASISFASGGTVCVRGINDACPTPAMGAARCITVSSRPDNISAISGPSSVCPGGVYSFSVSPVSGMSYQWSLPAGCSISENLGNSISVVWNRSSSGTVSVTGNNGCANSNTSSKAIGIAACRMSAGSVESTTELTAYPNPAENQLTVALTSDQVSVCKMQLVDLTGRVVKQETRQAQEGVNKYELDLGSMARGLYLLQVENGSTVQTLKITLR